MTDNDNHGDIEIILGISAIIISIIAIIINLWILALPHSKERSRLNKESPKEKSEITKPAMPSKCAHFSRQYFVIDSFNRTRANSAAAVIDFPSSQV